MRITCK